MSKVFTKRNRLKESKARAPDKLSEFYHELLNALCLEAIDHLRLSDLSEPITMTLGEKYAFMAAMEINIADRIVSMYKRKVR